MDHLLPSGYTVPGTQICTEIRVLASLAGVKWGRSIIWSFQAKLCKNNGVWLSGCSFSMEACSAVVEYCPPLRSMLLLTGQEGAITAPAEAAQSTKHTSDLLRRFKEYATSVKENMKAEPPPLTDEETMLRNEKIRVDDFQEKMIDASRKVCVCTGCRTCVV